MRREAVRLSEPRFGKKPELDARLLELGVSPGGSADLLAGTLFLDAIERPQSWLGSIGAESFQML